MGQPDGLLVCHFPGFIALRQSHRQYRFAFYAGQSVDVDGGAVEVSTTGRHDPCVGIRATPIAEAMLALVLLDHALRHRAQMGEKISTIKQIPPEPSE